MHNKIFFNIIIVFILMITGLLQSYTISKRAKFINGWGMSFINNEEILVSEKNGKIKIINLNSNIIKEISHNLNYTHKGQGGLLDILFKNNKVWISYSEILRNGSTTSVAVGLLKNNSINFKNIFRAQPVFKSYIHYGSRIAFKGDHLYITVGDRGMGMIAQDPTKDPGSIIRIKPSGITTKENPKFHGYKSWNKKIYQIGVRNPQGLTVSPYDNKIYLTNHGAKGGDWFGEIKYGENYGWKKIGWGGKNYIGTKIGPKWKKEFTKPLYYWTPSIGISALVIYRGNEFSNWNGHALITSLKDQSLRKINFKNKNSTTEEVIFEGKVGRIRNIKIHPESGVIFLLTDNALWELTK